MRTATVIGARALAVIAVALTTGVLAATESAASTPSETAPGGPGAQSYLDLARKDCFGTARNTTSKVWFTVVDGVLSDTFSPTIENSNVNTLQYIVTDGRSFTDMQQRDMTHVVSSPDRSGMVCQATSRDPKHGFALVTDYLTDPARDSVVMHTTLEPLNGTATAALDSLKVYVRYDAQIDNTGGGGTTNALPNNAVIVPATRVLVSSDTTTPTGPWAAPVVGALTADRRFERASSGSPAHRATASRSSTRSTRCATSTAPPQTGTSYRRRRSTTPRTRSHSRSDLRRRRTKLSTRRNGARPRPTARRSRPTWMVGTPTTQRCTALRKQRPAPTGWRPT